MAFNTRLDPEHAKVWTPVEAERWLEANGYEWCRRYVEGDYAVYVVEPRIPSEARLSWEIGAGRVVRHHERGSFEVLRLVKQTRSSSGRELPAQELAVRMVAFPTLFALVVHAEEIREER